MEEPTEEPTGEPTAEPAEEPTEEPTAEPTEEPTKEPAEEPTVALTGEPLETNDPAEIVENVDLDADVYEAVDGTVALNEGDGPLEFVRMEDGVPVTARPRLMQNGSKIRVSLDDLCQCEEDWRITDDGFGAVVLEAQGYTLALYNEDSGCSATVDGLEVPMKDDDMDFLQEGHFINAEFLASSLKGEAEWDQEESTLMLRIRHKTAVESED